MKKTLLLASAISLMSLSAQAQYYQNQRQYYHTPYQQNYYQQNAAPSVQPQQQYIESRYIHPYLGVSYAYSMADFDDDITLFGDENYKIFDDKFHSLGFSAGLKFHPNFAVELSYQKSNKAKGSSNYSYTGYDLTDNANFKTEADLQTFAIDLLGYLPVDEGFSFLGSVGVGFYKLKYSGTYSVVSSSSSGILYGSESDSESENKVGFRIGVGAEYFMTDNLALRGLARFNLINTKGSEIADYHGTKMDDWGKLNHTIDFNLGLFYYF
ncbi:MAG: porin family protein [Alphaproteobacteria bacterium]|nr:porin family protein [Alphaproteobacteria bacterium]